MNWRGCSALILSLTFLWVSSCLPLQAEPFPPNMETFKGRFHELEKELDTKLNLTPQQKKLLEENKKNLRQTVKEHLVKMKNLKLDMHALLSAPNLDPEALKKKHQEVKDLLATMMDLRLQGILKISEILTVAQQTILQTDFEEMVKKMPPDPKSGGGSEPEGIPLHTPGPFDY